MTTENWLTLIGIVSSGIVGYFVKYTLDKKAQFSSKNAEIKREMYQEYVSFILSFISDIQNRTNDITPEQSQKAVDKMREFHRKAVLYSSPKVINAYSDMMQHSYKSGEQGFDGLHYMVLMTNVFKAMRKDIGLSNRGLRSGGIRLIRPLINDYDTAIKPKEIGLLLNAKTSQQSSITKQTGKKR
jgi:hypothetical protein